MFPGQLADYGLIGTLDTIGERIARWEEAGVDELVVGFQDALNPRRSGVREGVHLLTGECHDSSRASVPAPSNSEYWYGLSMRSSSGWSGCMPLCHASSPSSPRT